jgi:AcrR family transcriptional regulator
VARPYRQRLRARQQEDTRRRVLDAAIALYESVGPAASTISAIAELADVQRLTVYRHFGDDGALLAAAHAHWRARHPPPDAARWRAVPDPRQRLRGALDALYAWYESSAPMLAALIHDRARLPGLAPLVEPFDQYMQGMRDALADGWGVTGRPRGWLVALIGHAASLETWRSLVRVQGLSSVDAARLMARTVADLARDPYA